MKSCVAGSKKRIPLWGAVVGIVCLLLSITAASAGGPARPSRCAPTDWLMPGNVQIWTWTAQLTRLGKYNEDFPGIRHAGTWVDHWATWWLARRLRSFGLDEVRREPVPMLGWDPTEYGLTVHADAEDIPLDGWPIYYAAFLAEKSVTAEMVYVGLGFPDDFAGKDVAGKIVVVDLVAPPIPQLENDVLRAEALETYDPDGTLLSGEGHPFWAFVNQIAYSLAAQGGAVALVGINGNKSDDHRFFQNALFVGADPHQGILGPLSGLYVSSRTGAALRPLAMAGTTATLVSDGETPQTETHNVVGVLRGRTRDIIQISGHSDGGAVNDATGAAEVLALARYYARRAHHGRPMNKTLQFVITGGHFTGDVGIDAFMEEHADDVMLDTVLNITVEHIGKHYDLVDGALIDSGLSDMRGIFLSDNALLPMVSAAVHQHDLKRTFILPLTSGIAAGSGEGWAWHVRGGLPSIWQISPVQYMQSTADTLEKVDFHALKRVASTLAEIVDFADENL